MCHVLLEHMQTVLRMERQSPSDANTFLVDKMLENKEAGWFSEFVSALKSAGKCFMFVFDTHIHATADELRLRFLCLCHCGKWCQRHSVFRSVSG